MPLLKHARKKLRQDKKRTIANKKVKTTYKSMVKEARENPSSDSISAAVSSIDKAVKNHIIHKNKASRIKSSLSKIESTGTAGTTPKKTATKSVGVKGKTASKITKAKASGKKSTPKLAKTSKKK